MRLYVNGDSHTAAAEAVNTYAFAEDDPALFYMGRAPHPANLAVSWCRKVSDTLKAVLHCDAESASSNQRIMRTTREWIEKNKLWLSETVMIIQWSTWERQEWLIDGTYYQINASGIDDVPESHQEQYKQFVATVDWTKVTEQAHSDIWNFHCELEDLGIKHVFFNGNNHFGDIGVDQRKDWINCYIKPYDPTFTYNQQLLNNGFETVAPNSWHFGKDAHRFWGRFMLQYCIDNQLMA
jgi:hypothetical protein